MKTNDKALAQPPVPEAVAEHPDFERGPHRAAQWLVGVIAAFLLLLVLWMCFARLDISVNATGAVVPSSRVQQLQSMEGGILQALLVREGASVRKGEPLATVQNLQFNSEQGEAQQTYWGAQAALVRLQAEAGNRVPEFPPELEKNAPDLVREQRALWQTRRLERENTLATLTQQLAQRQQELADARSRFQAANEAIGPSREALAIEEKLAAAGAGARAGLLAAQQRYATQKGELESARIAISRTQSGVQEAQSRLGETRARFMTETSKEKSEFELRAATVGEQLTSRNDRVARRELVAPMDGVVNRLLLNTVGGVVKPGETIMEIIPAEDKLLIAARVKPNDIAFIKLGQSARIRVTAYDSSIFGALNGRVVRVGADAITDNERKETYFEVFLEAEKNYLGEPGEKLTISPGMATDASIHTGKRTILEYLLKPVAKTLDKSLRER